jgi:hypothetical protein
MTEFRAMAMATSDAQKRAVEKYAQTEKGKQVRQGAVKKYLATEQGEQRLSEAQERFEQTDERKAYKRQWMKDYYQRKKAEKEQQSS